MKIILGIEELHGCEGTIEKIAEEYGCELLKKDQNDLTREDLLDADAVFGNPELKLLHDLPKLKLLQLHSAGSDQYAKLPIFAGENAPALCNTTGAYGRSIAEAVIGFFIGLSRQYFLYRDFQNNSEWHYLKAPDTLNGKKALVIGLGDIGLNIARLLDAFGCEVYAVKRTKSEVPSYIREVYTLDEMDSILPEMDFVSLSLPNSEETTHVINAGRLKLMKKTAFLANVGRGAAVDNMALAEALNADEIGGAALDVTEPEPLGPEHPLWKCRNCFITPHSSGMYFQRDPHIKIIGLFKKNLLHLLNGEPFENTVDLTTGYKKK